MLRHALRCSNANLGSFSGPWGVTCSWLGTSCTWNGFSNKRYLFSIPEAEVDQSFLPTFIPNPEEGMPQNAERAIELMKWHSGRQTNVMITLNYQSNVELKHVHIVRGVALLPHAWHPPSRVAVFTNDPTVTQRARAAGACTVGGSELIQNILIDETGQLVDSFDRSIAQRVMMPELGKLGRILAPLGKMPNPKIGGITDNPEKVLTQTSMQQEAIRLDADGAGQIVIGHMSFSNEQLYNNMIACLHHIWAARPPAWLERHAGDFILSMHLSSTYSPKIPVQVTDTMDTAAEYTTDINNITFSDVATSGGKEEGDKEEDAED